MDTDDVSDASQHIQLLDAEKRTLEAAMARDGQLPSDRKARGELVQQHEMRRL